MCTGYLLLLLLLHCFKPSYIYIHTQIYFFKPLHSPSPSPMETKGSGGGSSRKPPSASRASCNTIAKERDDRIERSEGLLCGHLHPAPSENFSLPASSQLIQSGHKFFLKTFFTKFIGCVSGRGKKKLSDTSE